MSGRNIPTTVELATQGGGDTRYSELRIAWHRSKRYSRMLRRPGDPLSEVMLYAEQNWQWVARSRD